MALKNYISAIYRIYSIKNGKCYIGSAKHYPHRMKCHFRRLERNEHHSRILQNHYNKYGAVDLATEIIELVPDTDNLFPREQYYLDLLNPKFNVCKIAGNTTGVKMLKSAVKKGVNARKGYVVSEETRRRLSVAGKNRVLSELHKQRIGESNKGKCRITDAHKEVLRQAAAARKGVPMPEWIKQKISDANKGKPKSENAKRKLSLARTGLRLSEEVKRRIRENRKPASTELKIKRKQHGLSTKNASVLGIMHERVRGRKQSPEHVEKRMLASMRTKALNLLKNTG